MNLSPIVLLEASLGIIRPEEKGSEPESKRVEKKSVQVQTAHCAANFGISKPDSGRQIRSYQNHRLRRAMWAVNPAPKAVRSIGDDTS